MPSGRVIEPPTEGCLRLFKNAFLERFRDNKYTSTRTATASRALSVFFQSYNSTVWRHSQ